MTPPPDSALEIGDDAVAALPRQMPTVQRVGRWGHNLRPPAPVVRGDFRRANREEDRRVLDALEGQPAPALEVTSPAGAAEPLKLAALRGNVVLIDFWGVWCGPCRAAMPWLRTIHEQYRERGLVIVGVHTTYQAEDMAEYVQREQLPWAAVADVDDRTVTAFGVRHYPAYYLVDRTGVVRFAALHPSEMERALDMLLDEHAD